jgi:HSP20 family protein
MISLYSPLFDLLAPEEAAVPSWLQRVTQGFAPAVDIHETPVAYVLSVELPGVRLEDVDVKLEKSALILSGSRRYEQKAEGGGFRRVERRYGNFSRSFTLPDDVDPDGIEAHLEDGVLMISVPKGTKGQARKITVKGALPIEANEGSPT